MRLHHYITKIIDVMIEDDRRKVPDYDISYENSWCQQTAKNYNKNVTLSENECKDLSDRNPKKSGVRPSQARDFNYLDKKVGYLTQVPIDFQFIGPDREPVEIGSIDTLLDIANIIRDTGQPNYKFARIPIKSGLQVQTWEKYLRDYSDKEFYNTLNSVFPCH